MRPSPAEIVIAVREALRPLGAELQSTEARAAMRRVMYVLREGRWDEAGFDLLAENRRLSEALTRLGRPFADGEPPASFRAANLLNGRLRAALCEALEEATPPAATRAGLARLLLAPD